MSHQSPGFRSAPNCRGALCSLEACGRRATERALHAAQHRGLRGRTARAQSPPGSCAAACRPCGRGGRRRNRRFEKDWCRRCDALSAARRQQRDDGASIHGGGDFNSATPRFLAEGRIFRSELGAKTRRSLTTGRRSGTSFAPTTLEQSRATRISPGGRACLGGGPSSCCAACGLCPSCRLVCRRLVSCPRRGRVTCPWTSSRDPYPCRGCGCGCGVYPYPCAPSSPCGPYHPARQAGPPRRPAPGGRAHRSRPSRPALPFSIRSPNRQTRAFKCVALRLVCEAVRRAACARAVRGDGGRRWWSLISESREKAEEKRKPQLAGGHPPLERGRRTRKPVASVRS